MSTRSFMTKAQWMAGAIAIGVFTGSGCRGDDTTPPDIFVDYEASGHFPVGDAAVDAAIDAPDTLANPDGTDAMDAMDAMDAVVAVDAPNAQ